MRIISPTSLAKLAVKTGNEPINILAIQWVEDGDLDMYADRDLSDGTKGKILSVSELDNVINFTGSGQSQEISVVLDDHDGSIKAILDTNDIHKRPCYVYQWFDGLALSEKFLVFKGLVSSPINWNESDRSISFNVIAKLEDREIGFSAEEGEFSTIPEKLVGQAWPMVFGTALNVPALSITEALVGTVTSGLAIHDFTIPLQIDVLNTQHANTFTIALMFRDLAEFADSNGDISGKTDFLHRKAAAETRLGQLNFQIIQQQAALDEQISEEHPTCTILGGEKFPQNRSITLDIGGGLFTGYFNDTTFHITSRQHPKFADTTFKRPFITSTLVTKLPDSGPRELVTYYENRTGDTASFFFAEAGSRVKMATGETIDQVVSIVPGTVKSVQAYRAFEGVRRLVTVPPSYYTVRTDIYGSISAVMIRLLKPLSSRDGEGWEDTIYVTFESSIGPNTVDILEYLISLYTPELSVDSTSFNSVRTRLDPYPSNFALLERKNVFTVLEEIAHQARCAIWLSGDTFYIRYLPTEPTATITISQSDIVPETMEVFHTDTEELVTKLTAEWREDYAATQPNKVILKHNVKKYGTQELTEDYYIYNSQELVIKSATFWLIRMANTWKKMRFKTYLPKLMLETLDPVTLAFSQTYISTDPITAIIEKANYDSASNQISFEVWTPVKAGTMVAYDFAWPADVDQSLVFPTLEEEFAGNAGGNGPGHDANGTLPTGPTFVIEGYRANQNYGDKHPSDTGNTAPLGPVVINSGLFNLANPGLTTPSFQTNLYNPGASTSGNSIIDIRKTIVTDSTTGKQAKFDSFFKQIKDEKLQMDTSAVLNDGTNEGSFDFKYDAVNSPNKFAAGRAYLLE